MFKFLSYLRVDSGVDIDELSDYEGICHFNESELIYLPLGEEVPLIQNSKCKSLAHIRSITHNEEGTTDIEFTIVSITRELADAYTLTYKRTGKAARQFSDMYELDMATPIVGEEEMNIGSYTKKNKKVKRIGRF